MREIIRILLSIIISIILSLAIYYGVNANGLTTKLYGYTTLIVSSGSMQPELMVGDVIIIKECDSYNKNDIITFNVDNQYLVTHRIIEKNENHYITKGDNNNSADDNIVLEEQIEGKLIHNSKVLKFIYNNWILVILAIVVLLIIF